MPNTSVRAVFWDFGGVILSSPFDAFNAYEAEAGLPRDFIRRINSTNPDSNAWSQLERSAISIEAFCDLFEEEGRALGHEVDARQVLSRLSGDVRPQMVAALKRIKPHYAMACLTNNVRTGAGPGMARSAEKQRQIDAIMTLFDEVIESSKVGVRKPEPDFYRMACEIMQVSPENVVFLDDLGINLKPARAMGMRTIKVSGPEQALADLEDLLDMSLRDSP